jgi:hypothetical protein
VSLPAPLFKKAVSDSNAPVQEKALDALLAFQRAADADVSRFVRGYMIALRHLFAAVLLLVT